MKMPILSRFIVTLSAGLALAEGQVGVSVVESSITDADATTHEFEVVWTSPSGIDPTTLGDDDILLGRSTLFDLQLGSGAILATFIRAESEDDGKRVTATYAFDRPEDGWGSWGISRLLVTVEDDSVRDHSGAGAPFAGVARITIDLDEVPRISFRLMQTPIVTAEEPAVGFGVVYTTNYPLLSEPFEDHRIQLWASVPRGDDVDPEATEQGWIDGVDSMHLQLDAVAETISPDDSGQTVVVTYRAERPIGGWRGADELTVVLTPSTLGENYKLTLNPKSSNVLGSIRIAQADTVSASVVPHDPVLFDAQTISFDVSFVSTVSAIDLDSLGQDDLGVGPFTPFETGIQLFARFEDVVSIEDEGRSVTARYSLDQPLGGWREIGARATLRIDSVSGGVATSDLATLTGGHIGNIVFDTSEKSIAGQLVALNQWINDLGEVIGEEVTETSDFDKDGMADMLEYMTDTDPLDASDAAPLRVDIVEENNVQYLQLEFSHRVNLWESLVTVEGSVSGETWAPIRHLLTPHDPEPAGADGLRDEKLRAKLIKPTLPYQLFRLRLVPAH